jgi:hypothetical protein
VTETIALVTSPNIDLLPELSEVGRSSALLEPCKYDDWDDAFDAWPDADDYILGPGDYRDWGRCVIDGTNSAAHRRLIRFIDVGVKPWDRMSSEAVTLGFDFRAGADYWAVHGLTVRGPEQSSSLVRRGADHITFDSLLIENIGAYGVRLVGNNSTVQNCVIRWTAPGTDGVAIQVKVQRVPNVGNRVLDNEIYDCNDGFGVTWDEYGPNPFMECVGLLVEGNDIYLTETRRTDDTAYGLAENGIDIKAGPRTQAEPLKFARNRIWGFRRSVPGAGSGSIGSAVTIHRAAQRILFEHNVIFDCPVAFQEVLRDTDPEDPEQGPREVTVRSNIISMIRQYNTEDLGAILRTRLSFKLDRNWFSHSATLSALPKVGFGDEFINNVLYDTSLGEAEADWINGNGGNVNSEGGEMTDVLIERRRWTRRGIVKLDTSVRAGDQLF